MSSFSAARGRKEESAVGQDSGFGKLALHRRDGAFLTRRRKRPSAYKKFEVKLIIILLCYLVNSTQVE